MEDSVRPVCLLVIVRLCVPHEPTIKLQRNFLTLVYGFSKRELCFTFILTVTVYIFYVLFNSTLVDLASDTFMAHYQAIHSS